MPDYFLRDTSGAVTGPHTADFIQTRARSGAIGPAHAVAVVEQGAKPADGDFRSVDSITLAPTSQKAASGVPARPAPGAVLRILGWAVAVVGTVGAALSAGAPEAFAFGVFLVFAIQAVVGGGVLWGLGAILAALSRP